MSALPDAERRLAAPEPYDLLASMIGLRNGFEDPTVRRVPGGIVLARRTPDGPATLEARQDADGVVVRAWGPGAGWLVERAPLAAGFADRPEAFRPADRRMRDLVRRTPGLRLVRAPVVFDRVLQVVLLQLVTSVEGLGAWRDLVRGAGEPAPGPWGEAATGGLLVPPAARDVARLSEHALVGYGVLPRFSRTARRVAREARRLEAAAERGTEALAATLTAIRGVGPWTVGKVLGSALGDPDAVPTGDYNLPDFVAWNLTGEPRADDARMLELLAPYRGQRYRALRLLGAHGRRPPRRGPRMRLRPRRAPYGARA